MDRLKSINEAALKMRISRQTLTRIINNGEIGYTKILKRKKISDKQIEDYLSKQTSTENK